VIISDEHKFAFVHIPKCAGTSLRKALKPIDETIGHFDHIAEHPDMGMVNYGHLTLADLSAFFPAQFEKVATYRSVAIVRDPVERFYSALFQRLREFKGYDQSAITPKVIAKEADTLIAYLTSARTRLDLEFVHFNRQSDYIFLNGARIVDRVFALDRLSDAADYIADCTGIRLTDNAPENQTLALRAGRLTPFLGIIRRPYVALVPLAIRGRLRAAMTDAGLYARVKPSHSKQSNSAIDQFLRDYYRADFELLTSARAA
jgi:Sulfotransferase family